MMYMYTPINKQPTQKTTNGISNWQLLIKYVTNKQTNNQHKRPQMEYQTGNY